MRVPTTPSRSKGSITSNSPHLWTISDFSYFKIQPKISTIELFFGKQSTELRDFQLADPGYQDFLTADVLEPYSSTSLAGQAVQSALSVIRGIHFNDRSLSKTAGTAATSELAARLLAFVGVEGLTAYNLPIDLMMSGRSHTVQVDFALVDYDNSSILFLFAGHKDPLPQLLKMGIAAFQQNNRIRDIQGVPPLKTMIFPAIAFHVSLPCFYLLQITKALSEAVINDVSPDFVTPIFLLFPPVPPGVDVFGLFHVETRGPVLHVLENMKDFIPTSITHIPQGWLRFLTEEDIYEPADTVPDLDTKFLNMSLHNSAQPRTSPKPISHSSGTRSRESRNRKSRRSDK